MARAHKTCWSAQGADDDIIFARCCAEGRCLLTLDLDFSNVIRFPPAQSSGIVVIRVPRNVSVAVLEQMVARFLAALGTNDMRGNLWIVEVDRIRIHQSDQDL